jgi:hypothetical protein
MFPLILLIGFVAPIPWSLNIPQVYEAAIGAGQFFLMGGAYFALLGLDTAADKTTAKLSSSPAAYSTINFDKKYLFFAGLFWACSVGSRAINALSVIFFAALVLFWIVKADLTDFVTQNSNRFWRRNKFRVTAYVKKFLPLLIPLMAGAMLIGWYNWARFDSPFEFGLRYQITLFNLKQHTAWVFRPDYFPLNFYNYILQPFDFVSGFPFIRPRINTDFPATYFYAAGPVTGLLFSVPFLVFVTGLFCAKKKEHPQPYYFFIALLAGSFIINLLTLLFYFFSQTRFLVDLISQITLLSILGYWQLLSNKKPARVFIIAGNLLIIASVCAGLLLAFTSETQRMETLNPQLIEKFQP